MFNVMETTFDKFGDSSWELKQMFQKKSFFKEFCRSGNDKLPGCMGRSSECKPETMKLLKRKKIIVECTKTCQVLN